MSILPLFLVSDGILDGLHLDCHHREHFNGDTVEFIKASPGTGLG